MNSKTAEFQRLAQILAIGIWKYRKCAFPASECILGGLIDDEEFQIWVLAARMAEMVYYYGRNGWQEHDFNLFDNVAKRYMILVEEQFGLDQCVVTALNLRTSYDSLHQIITGVRFMSELFQTTLPLLHQTKETLNYVLQKLKVEKNYWKVWNEILVCKFIVGQGTLIKLNFVQAVHVKHRNCTQNYMNLHNQK